MSASGLVPWDLNGWMKSWKASHLMKEKTESRKTFIRVKKSVMRVFLSWICWMFNWSAVCIAGMSILSQSAILVVDLSSQYSYGFEKRNCSCWRMKGCWLYAHNRSSWLLSLTRLDCPFGLPWTSTFLLSQFQKNKSQIWSNNCHLYVTGFVRSRFGRDLLNFVLVMNQFFESHPLIKAAHWKGLWWFWILSVCGFIFHLFVFTRMSDRISGWVPDFSRMDCNWVNHLAHIFSRVLPGPTQWITCWQVSLCWPQVGHRSELKFPLRTICLASQTRTL